jgi:urea transporter
MWTAVRLDVRPFRASQDTPVSRGTPQQFLGLSAFRENTFGPSLVTVSRMSTTTKAMEPDRAVDPLDLAKVALRGFGQVMFQGHALTGVLFLAGIAVASPLMAVGAAVGAVIGPALAYGLKYDRGEIADGIYGFNPVLVGAALFFFLKPVALTWVLLVAGTALSAVVTYLMRRFLPFPTYTSPFVVCTWALLLLAHGLNGTAIDLKPAPPDRTPHGFIEAVLDGPAEVIFGANVATGLLFLAGIAVSNWRHAALGLGASVVGTLIALYHHDPAAQVSIGIYGYNAVLAAIAVYLWKKSLVGPVLAAIVSVPLTEFFPHSLGIPALTAPFVAASWVVVALLSSEPFFCKDS